MEVLLRGKYNMFGNYYLNPGLNCRTDGYTHLPRFSTVPLSFIVYYFGRNAC